MCLQIAQNGEATITAKVAAGREPTTSIPDIWGQDIRHTPKEITCASLTEPPRGIAQLSSKGNLLVAWQWWNSVAYNSGRTLAQALLLLGSAPQQPALGQGIGAPHRL